MMNQTGKLLAIILISASLCAAKTYRISGTILDFKKEKVGEAAVVLLDKDGNQVKEESTGKRGGGKGEFKFKKVKPGTYTVEASHKDFGKGQKSIVVTEDDVEDVEVMLSKVAPVKEKAQPTAKVEGVEEPPPDDKYVITELGFEVKKLAAEVSHLNEQVRELQAKGELWANPLSIYSKEIILENGSTVFGKVVYQDEEIMKVETLLGYLVLSRDQIVRVIDNVVTQEEPEYVPEQIRETYTPPPMPKLAKPKYTATEPTERAGNDSKVANVVLVGNIQETKDKSSNITMSGEVKNIGSQRGDFVKINFIFRKNWSGETKTLTTFIKGSYYTFETGITTDSSLLPGATGTFSLVIPADFGTFIGYSYTIDWEEYE